MTDNRTVASITDAELVQRAVHNARPKKGIPKWRAVADTFALGSTFAQQLCERFGFDPDASQIQP